MKRDQKIRQNIVGKLKSEIGSKASAITVEVYGGVVRLSGYVDRVIFKRMVEQLAHSVEHVKAVAMDLQVICPHHDKDSDIAVAVVSSFDLNPLLAGEDHIRISVDNGWITLGGYVDDYSKKVAAYNVASDIQHVKGVSNHIDVRVGV